MNKIKIVSYDPYYEAYDEEGNTVCEFDFYNEDPVMWNRLADQALEGAGYTRVSRWDWDFGELSCEVIKND